jgi:hypothetical protein
MLVRTVFRRNPREIGFEVAPCRGRGIFLNDERRRGVPAEQGQQPLADAAFSDERADFAGEFSQSRTRSANRQDGGRLAKHGAA